MNRRQVWQFRVYLSVATVSVFLCAAAAWTNVAWLAYSAAALFGAAITAAWLVRLP